MIWSTPTAPTAAQPTANKCAAEAFSNTRGAGLVQRAPRVFENASAAHLFAVGGAAVGAVGVDQIIFHVQHQIDRVFHQGFLCVMGVGLSDCAWQCVRPSQDDVGAITR